MRESALVSLCVDICLFEGFFVQPKKSSKKFFQIFLLGRPLGPLIFFLFSSPGRRSEFSLAVGQVTEGDDV